MAGARRRIARAAAIVAGAAAAVLAAGGVAAWLFLRASLPQLDGERALAGLGRPAAIVRDAQGSVTVRAADRRDLAFATGFAHAQDRFFQMDLTRRAAAGELAALVGPAALPIDQRRRLHRFRARAERAYAALPAAHQALLRRYADGVNAGLAALGARPFEYALLRGSPEPWRPADTLLIIYAMYFDLQGAEIERVLSRGALRELLPPALLAALTPRASHWDAPLDGIAPAAGADAAPPRPTWLDTPDAPRPWQWDRWRIAAAGTPPSSALGSNAWAVGAAHGADGRARIANDMHLGLRLPNIWYRLTLELPAAGGATRRVSGVSLPGAPVVVAGSNGNVAWGFTNSYGHFVDLVRLDVDPSDPRRYRGPDGAWQEAAESVETIAVRGAESVRLIVRDTRWGPMLQSGGRIYAVRWIAHLPDAANLALIGLETAADVPQALSVVRSAGVPTQNIMAVDRAGRIGWTLAGPLPAAALDPDGFPVEAAQAGAPLARLPAADYPSVIDPAGGRLWTANSTQLGDPAAQRRIGDGGADVGARATQIRDALFAADRFDEPALLAIQLDDRARWIEPWRRLALDTLDAAAVDGHPQRADFRRIVAAWNGRADADGAGYTLLRAFHGALYEAWFGPLDDRLAAVAPGLSVRHASSRLLPVMETLLRTQSWRPAYAADWRSFVLDRIDAAIAGLTAGGARLDDARWGERNRLAMMHPLARALPAPLRRWLSAPARPMPGDINMPRVQGAAFGASERFAVAPGHEEEGIMEMPGGASGHPLSPFFLAGHDAWAGGEPAAFLPGPDAHRLALVPAP
ncbi:penicillin acylase family protein [Pigmentiphaga soli]|uniref:Penicillin acylase family protein n=1 Tax=Pigmentiphaga soli TaxID=1007095 RepID=A0ABP8GKP5_9BURK